MRNNEDKELKRILKCETDIATKKQEETWNNIEQELFPMKKKSPRRNRIAVGIGTVAAAFILIIISASIFTNEQAGEQQKPVERSEHPTSEVEVPLKDQYEEDIQREREPEGQLEVVDMKLAVNEDEQYIIYVPKEKYEFEFKNGEGRINFNVDLDDMYPEVGMTIQQHTDTTMDDLIAGIKEKITKEDMTVKDEESISYPFDTYAITAYANEDTNEWNSPVHRYYVYEADQATYFVFKQMYFMEGMGSNNSIFDFMLETFEYVSKE